MASSIAERSIANPSKELWLELGVPEMKQQSIHVHKTAYAFMYKDLIEHHSQSTKLYYRDQLLPRPLLGNSYNVLFSENG